MSDAGIGGIPGNFVADRTKLTQDGGDKKMVPSRGDIARGYDQIAGAPGWRSMDTAPAGVDVLLSYRRSADLPEPWPLVIIAHRDKEGFWVWQNRAARSYSVAPIGWQFLPEPA